MRVARWLASRRGPQVAVLLGVLVTLPALRVGFLLDDLLHRIVLDGRGAGYDFGGAGYHLAAHELYGWTSGRPDMGAWMIERGFFPWFADPELSFRFFRPLSSLLLALDQRLFGNDPLPAHVHSLLWFVVASIVAAAIFRSVLSRTSATIATAIYALAGAHMMTTAWVASRHALVSAALGAIAVWAHVRWRANGWRAGAWLAPIAFIAGMCGGETALGTVIFVGLYELIARRDSIGVRARAALPIFLLGLAFLVFYALSGYGARNSAMYISPFSDPIAFCVAVIERAPLLVADLYAGVPAEFSATIPALHPPVAVIGVAAAAAVIVLSLGAQRRRMLWLFSSSLLCVLPGVAGLLGGRALSLALIGSAAVVAAAIVECVRRAKRGRALARWSLRAAVLLIVCLHLLVPVLVRTSGASLFASLSQIQEGVAERADLSACPERGDAYVLTGSDPMLSLSLPSGLIFHTPEKAARIGRLRVLSMAPNEQELTVTDRNVFEVRVHADERTPSPFESLYRDEPLRIGQRVSMPELNATALAVGRGMPMLTRFEHQDDLSSVCFLVWRDGRLRSMRPPPVGRRRVIVRELGPMGM